MMVYLGSCGGIVALVLAWIELGWAWYGLQKLVIRVYRRLIGSVKSARKRIIFLLLLNDEAILWVELWLRCILYWSLGSFLIGQFRCHIHSLKFDRSLVLSRQRLHTARVFRRLICQGVLLITRKYWCLNSLRVVLWHKIVLHWRRRHFSL